MNTHLEFDRTLRIAIIRHLIDKGRAPEVRELAATYDATDEQVEASLTRLHEHHALVLHPHSHRIWIIHPFSTAPTPFFVTSARGGWWANCAKCALGIASLIDEDVTIHTRLGAESTPLEIRVQNGRLLPTGLVMHVALPVAHWWDNVLYTCSTILFFQNEPQVNAWCAAHAVNRGAVMPLETAWQLAHHWYNRAAAPDWRRKTAAEASALFESLGLVGEFWRVPETWR